MDIKEFNDRIYNCKGDILTSRHDFLVFIGTEQDSYHFHCRDGVFMDIPDQLAALAYTTLQLGVYSAEWMTRGSLVFPDSEKLGRGLPLLAVADTSSNRQTETDNMDPGSCLIVEGIKLEDMLILFDSDTDLLRDFIPNTYLHRMMLSLRQESMRDYEHMKDKRTH